MKIAGIKYLVIVLMMASASMASADVFDDIISLIKAQNAKGLTNYFNNNVALTVDDTEGVYSKQQAEIILKHFFTLNPPKTVEIKHRSSTSGTSRYVIGTYETTQGEYRVYVFMKGSGNGMLIHEMRFEKL